MFSLFHRKNNAPEEIVEEVESLEVEETTEENASSETDQVQEPEEIVEEVENVEASQTNTSPEEDDVSSLSKDERWEKKWISDITNPDNKYYLYVQKKTINRADFLAKIKRDGQQKRIDAAVIDRVADKIDKMLWGFDIIDPLINDRDDVSDIRLIDENTIRIKSLGRRMATDIKFDSKNDYLRFIEHITTRNNTNTSIVNAAQVFTDKVSSDRCILRFSLVSDLVNTNDHPTLLIRKILKQKKSFARLLSEHYMTPDQLVYIKKRWATGHGILICGPNGSGKTTLINALLDETPAKRSAVVIQESEELFCDVHPEMIFRKIIPKKQNSSISYTISDLCRLALMESFDLLIVGEVKGKEAAEISYATYTGSQCMTSVHSISAKDGYSKMIDYAMESEKKATAQQYAKQFQALDTVLYVQDYHVAQIEESHYDPHSDDFFSFNTVYHEENGIDNLQQHITDEDRKLYSIQPEPQVVIEEKPPVQVVDTAPVEAPAPVEEPVPAKPKRGRKPKAAQESVQPVAEEVNPAPEAQQPAKRRGRPKKTEEAAAPVAPLVEPKVETKTTKKQAGKTPVKTASAAQKALEAKRAKAVKKTAAAPADKKVEPEQEPTQSLDEMWKNFEALQNKSKKAGKA